MSCYPENSHMRSGGWRLKGEGKMEGDGRESVRVRMRVDVDWDGQEGYWVLKITSVPGATFYLAS